MTTAPQPDGEPLEDLLRLALAPGVGPRLRRALLDRFGSSATALRASVSQLRSTPGVGEKVADSIRRAARCEQTEALIANCRREGVSIVVEGDDGYPPLLREIHDPPAALFVRGAVLPVDAAAVALVGSRKATHYGRRQTERLARQLAAGGMTVISGLARGVDASAHEGALAAGGRTLAVLGGGVCRIYPSEHEGLAGRVSAQGALISETPPWQSPKSSSFPRRNRLITGMSLGVVVVEASARSGALISARHATEQGREVFAVPGRIDNPLARGCHNLLRDGAKLVECVEDILEELGSLHAAASARQRDQPSEPPKLQLNEDEQAVYGAIQTEPTAIDLVALESGLPLPQVLSTISGLELRRLIQRVSGYYVTRKT